MKLLIVSHTCVNPVGQQFYAEVERQTGWQMTIVTPSLWRDEYGNKLNTERWPGFQGQLVSVPVWKSGNIPLHTYKSFFIKLLRELSPDFIYLYQEPYSVQAFQVYLANRLTIRKPIGFFTWQNIFKRYPIPFRQTEGWVLRQTSVAFPGSRSAEEVLRKKGYKGRMTLLPSGIDSNIYFARPEAAALKSGLRTAEDEIIIGYVGRIVEEKGLKTLLHALKLVQDLSWRLVVVGSGPYGAEFNKIAQDLQLTQRINQVGYVPQAEAPAYLSAFDLLVLPSETRANWKEQFGRVIVEGMACGTPLVGSDSGEIPHLIQATGGGLTFPEGQPEALAKQLQRLISNPLLRSQLSERGRREVLQNYTHASLAVRFAQAVEEATQRGSLPVRNWGAPLDELSD